MMMTVKCRCPLCGAISAITCSEESLQAYEEGLKEGKNKENLKNLKKVPYRFSHILNYLKV